MFKVALPLVFVLFADGKLAGGKEHPDKAGVATERSTEHAKASEHAKATEPAKAAKEPAAPREHAVEGDRPDRDPTTGDAGKSLVRPGEGKPDKAAKKGAKGEHAPSGEPERTVTPPPGISGLALRDEMGARAGANKAASERDRLEALSTDLSRTRTALREETLRLEAMMDKAKQTATTKSPSPPPVAPPAPAAPAAGAAPGAPGAPARSTEGGPMPLGDPLAPSAYYRPAPPPPNFAIQVEVVSKAMKSMKPEQAAGILGHLERGLAAEVLQRMRPADAGAILGFLKPEVGAALAAEIVSRPPVGRNRDKEDKDKP